MKSVVALEFPYLIPFLKFREANGALIGGSGGDFIGESNRGILLLDKLQKLRRRDDALVGVGPQAEDGAYEDNEFENEKGEENCGHCVKVGEELGEGSHGCRIDSNNSILLILLYSFYL